MSINTFPIPTKKISELDAQSVVLAPTALIPIVSRAAGDLPIDTTQRATAKNFANQLTTHLNAGVLSSAFDLVIDEDWGNFLLALSMTGASLSNRDVLVSDQKSIFISNVGELPFTVAGETSGGPTTILPGDTVFVMATGVGHIMVPIRDQESAAASATPFLNITETDFTNATHYYYGGLDENGQWKINRYLKSNTTVFDSATQATSGGSFVLAWVNRISLTYS